MKTLALMIVIVLVGRVAGAVEVADVVVYGGTPGGIVAAIAAAREKGSVVLIEPSRQLGGMVAGGLSHTDVGRRDLISGIALEFFDRAAGRYGEAHAKSAAKFYSEPRVARETFEAMLKEAAVKVFRGERLDRKAGVTLKAGRITEIRMESGLALAGRVFIDATYEGDLMAGAGVKYIVGREGRSTYNEPLAGFYPARLRPRSVQEMAQDDPCIAPGAKGLHYVHGTPAKISARDEAGNLLPGINGGPWPAEGSGDGRTQAYNFRVILTRKAENRVAFYKPLNYDPKRYELLLRIIQNYPGIRFSKLVHLGPVPGEKFDANAIGMVVGTDHPGANTGYPDGDYGTRARIWQDHVDYVQGNFYFIANDPRVPEDLRKQAGEWGLAKDEFVDNFNWPYALYVREARRMVGPIVLTQNDLTKQVTKADSIAMGAFIMDSHCVQRLVDGEGNVIDEGNFDIPVRPYEIPYRAITPKKQECGNLLVVVCVSASHVAYGSIRMEPQYMMMGHAAGVAAVMAGAEGAVQEVDVAGLQGRLRKAGQVLHLRDTKEGSNSIEAGTLKGIVIDDEQAVFAGEWTASSYGVSVEGGYRHDANAGKGEKTARFEFKVPGAGEYEVRLGYNAYTNRAENVPVTIHHAGGESTVKVNQKQAGSIEKVFVSLGTFAFDSGGAVVISNRGTSGFVVADAVWVVQRK